MPTNIEKTVAVQHAKDTIHDEEAGDYLRTGRSGVVTKLGALRQHDHGEQELAAHHVVHTATRDGNAIKKEHEIEHVHEHRTLLSGFTL